MLSRRHFSAGLLAGLALPGPAFGQAVDEVRRRARALRQLQAIMV